MIEPLREEIKMHGMENCVTPEEILEYLNADTYENDSYTLNSILKNKYLILHEILEVCCIKKRGVDISKDVILNHRELVYECHLEAIDRELEYARKMDDREWIRARVKDMESYLDDPYLPRSLRKKVVELIEKWRVQSFPFSIWKSMKSQ